jgi:hypothetical protein
MLVGILAALAEVHDAAAFHSEAAREFLPERLPCRVLVYGDLHCLLVFEVRLHEAVHHVRLLWAPAGTETTSLRSAAILAAG